jgi:hypothetical protein
MKQKHEWWFWGTPEHWSVAQMRTAIDEVWLGTAELQMTGSTSTCSPTEAVMAAMLEQVLNESVTEPDGER